MSYNRRNVLTASRSYIGYIDVGLRHLFFYFFESRSHPESDDVILWTNGGSSATGLFMEIGESLILC